VQRLGSFGDSKRDRLVADAGRSLGDPKPLAFPHVGIEADDLDGRQKVSPGRGRPAAPADIREHKDVRAGHAIAEPRS
jgi:hypothetical protein